ncbi:MAG: hypothetical protein LJE70_03205 [Chromatiaceae bacterium]|nr:hypothetical protein [Chromatiaceae bacterium]
MNLISADDRSIRDNISQQAVHPTVETERFSNRFFRAKQLRNATLQKQIMEQSDKGHASFSLLDTLAQYEVEELNAREIADLIAKSRTKKGRIHGEFRQEIGSSDAKEEPPTL